MIKSVAEYVKTYLELKKQFAGRSVDYDYVCKKVTGAARFGDDRIHPMVKKMFFLADYLSLLIEDPPTNPDEHVLKSYWDDLVNLAEKYDSGKWQPTIWGLKGTFQTPFNAKPGYGFGLKMWRENGNLKVMIADETIKKAIEEVAERVDDQQTDEWFLRNIAYLLPETLGDLELMEVRVVEFLASSPWL